MCHKNKSSKKQAQDKTATDNQWTNTSLDQESLPRDRKDGPGGN